MTIGSSDHRRRMGILIALAPWLIAGQLTCAKVASAQPPVEEVKLVLHPVSEPQPALKYRLLPGVLDRKPGNAAVLYNKIAIRFGDEHAPPEAEKLADWAKTPVAELPLEEVEKTLAEYRDVLDDLHLAARYEDCDWQLPLWERDFIELRLPAAQSARNFAWLLAVQARVHVARGDFDQAIRTLQTGFAMGRHMAEGPTLVHCLVGAAVSNMMADQVRDLIAQPDAPNLYWALTTLPRPLIDLRKAAETEMDVLYLSYPALRHVDDRSRTPEYWEQQWQQLLENLDRWHGESRRPKSQARLGRAALALGGYPTAKRGLVQQGWPPEEVERMPVAQVLLLYTMRTYDQLRDDTWKWFYLRYWEAAPAEWGWRDLDMQAARREIVPLARVLLPAVQAAHFAVARCERTVALLRTLEALRLYGAGHDGRLPASLDKITEVPIPSDPLFGEPFQYQLREDTAVLEARTLTRTLFTTLITRGVRFEIRFTR